MQVDGDLVKADPTSLKRGRKGTGEGGGVRKKFYASLMLEKQQMDFESAIPVAQVGLSMGPFGLAKMAGKEEHSEESDSEESEGSEGSESSEERGSGVRRSGPPQPSQPAGGGAGRGQLLSERKPVKHFCKFCDQSFLSK